jgi:hypothetical protein
VKTRYVMIEDMICAIYADRRCREDGVSARIDGRQVGIRAITSAGG